MSIVFYYCNKLQDSSVSNIKNMLQSSVSYWWLLWRDSLCLELRALLTLNVGEIAGSEAPVQCFSPAAIAAVAFPEGHFVFEERDISGPAVVRSL